MSALPGLDPVPVFRIGRGRTWHRARVVIEPPTGRAADQRVVVKSRCGLVRDADEGFTETFGLPTCAECGAAA